MVGIVVVSHSEALADGVVTLAREMASPELLIEAAGGFGEAGSGGLGTDAERVRGAIERAMSADGVLVLMDLGSALMSAEMASEMLDGAAGAVRLSAAPLVEGAVAAAVAASGGAGLDEVAAEARGALAMKVGQVREGDGAADDDGGARRDDDGARRDDDGARSGEATAELGDVTAELEVANEIGLHARPAARVVETLRAFDAVVLVRKAGSVRAAGVSARSLTNLVALGARQGDTLLVGASGAQAHEAIKALRELAAGGFGDGVTRLGVVGAPTAAPERGDLRAPERADLRAPERGDTQAPVGTEADGQETGAADAGSGAPFPAAQPVAGSVLRGVAVSAGVVVGPAHRIGGGPAGPPPERAADTVQAELALLERGLAGARARATRDGESLRGRGASAEAAIFDAHLALLEDEALLEPARAAIVEGATAELAIYRAAADVAQLYRGLDDRRLAERGTDVLDVGGQVVSAIMGDRARTAKVAGTTEDAARGDSAVMAGIVIAEELTPSQSARLDPALVGGIATARGSVTAHAAIIARSLGIPAALGLGPGILAVADGTMLLLDGDAGTVTVAPDREESARAVERGERDAGLAGVALAGAQADGALLSGERIQVYANIGSASDAGRAVLNGAEGVGMLRTEFLYLDRPTLPDEQEQYETFREIGRALAGRPLIIRTLDAGADKPLAALRMPPERNPFLGMRGIRVGLAQPEEVLVPQLRAALRAAAEFPVKLMMPMVATLGEVITTRSLIDEARASLGIDAEMEVGITLEVPAAAVMAEQLAAHLDFFSLGTNDLTQYTMAAERGDARLAALLATPQPAVLRLVKLIVEGAAGGAGAGAAGAGAAGASAAGAGADKGCWVGVCGEMAGDPASAILLAGLGVTELSMSPGLIPAVKQTLRSVTLDAARDAAERAMRTADAVAARACAVELL